MSSISSAEDLENIQRELVPPPVEDLEYTPQKGERISPPCCDEKNTFFNYGWEPWHLMPYAPSIYKRDLSQIGNEIFAGLSVALAQVSESIAFAFIAGVGLCIALT